MSDHTEKQHIVPRFYLENFTDGNGMVWSYDFINNKVFARIPLKTARVKNFYSPVNDDGHRLDSRDDLNTIIEDYAAPLWNDLKIGKLMVGEDREKIALFVANQYLRSPTVVGAMAETVGQIHSQRYQMLAASPSDFNTAADRHDLETGTVSSSEQRERVRNIVLDGNYTTNVLQTEGHVVARSMDKITKILMMMKWVVLRSAHQHLITSDSPVVLVSDPKTHSQNSGDGRFLNKTVRVSLPLSADRLIEMTWEGKEREGVIDITKQIARQYNAIRASHAERFLYCNQEDAGIFKLESKRVGKSFRTVKVPTGLQTPKIVVKRSFGYE